MSTLKFWDDFLFQNPDLIETLAKKLYAKEVKKNYAKNYEDYKYYEKAADSTLPYVKRKLFANDKKPLRNYDGRKGASAKTYLSLLVRFRVKNFLREMELIKRRRYRRTKWLKEQNNPLLEKVHKLLCYEQYSEPCVIDRLKHQNSENWDLATIKEAIKTIRDEYPDCAKPAPVHEDSGSEQIGSSHVDNRLELGFHHKPLEAAVIDKEEELIRIVGDRIIAFLFPNIFRENLNDDVQKFLTSDEIEKPIKDKILKVADRIINDPKLTEDEQLFLKIWCHGGKKKGAVVDAARAARWTVKSPQHKKKRILKRLHKLIGNDVEEIKMQLYKSIKQSSRLITMFEQKDR